MIAFLYSTGLQDISPQTGTSIGLPGLFEPQRGFSLDDSPHALVEEPSCKESFDNICQKPDKIGQSLLQIQLDWEQRLDTIRQQLEAIEQQLLQIQRELEAIQRKLNDIAEKLIELQQSLAERITSHVPIIQKIKTFADIPDPPISSIFISDIDGTLGYTNVEETITQAPTKDVAEAVVTALFSWFAPSKKDRQQAKEDLAGIVIKNEKFCLYPGVGAKIGKIQDQLKCLFYTFTNVESENSPQVYEKLKKVGIVCSQFPQKQDMYFKETYGRSKPIGSKGIFLNDKYEKSEVFIRSIIPWLQEHASDQLNNGLTYVDDISENILTLAAQRFSFPLNLYHVAP